MTDRLNAQALVRDLWRGIRHFSDVISQSAAADHMMENVATGSSLATATDHLGVQSLFNRRLGIGRIGKRCRFEDTDVEKLHQQKCCCHQYCQRALHTVRLPLPSFIKSVA